MVIGSRLRALRTERNFSQEDVEKRSGLLRCYLSRVENGHTVPSVQTLEKLARALEVSLPQLFYGVEQGQDAPKIPHKEASNEALYGGTNEEVRLLSRFRRHLRKMAPDDRRLLFNLAKQMAKRAR